jgi:hypothetical protein
LSVDRLIEELGAPNGSAGLAQWKTLPRDSELIRQPQRSRSEFLRGVFQQGLRQQVSRIRRRSHHRKHSRVNIVGGNRRFAIHCGPIRAAKVPQDLA